MTKEADGTSEPANVKTISIDDLGLLGSLSRGELQPIADHFRKFGDLHPMVFRQLMLLIDGDSRSTAGWRLALIKHPDIPRLTHGREVERRQAKANLIPTLMRYFGVDQPGHYEAAVSETAAHIGLSEARVRQVWDRALKAGSARTSKSEKSD